MYQNRFLKSKHLFQVDQIQTRLILSKNKTNKNILATVTVTRHIKRENNNWGQKNHSRHIAVNGKNAGDIYRRTRYIYGGITQTEVPILHPPRVKNT